MSKPKRRRKSTRFVPRLVVGVSLVAVVPACAGCTGPSTSVAADAFSVARDAFGVADRGFGVADAGFPHDARALEAGVADVAFDAGPTVAADAFAVADTGFSVADTGFEAGPTVAADAFGVADTGFGPG